MSQKSTHNSKRRPPSDNAEGQQQDADWGFDPDEADPALEKKLAVALVVCLLAGFGFVFYQKFRLLRSDDTRQAGAETRTEQVEQTETGDAELRPDNQTLALGTAPPEAPASPDTSAASKDAESPFYERDETEASLSVADADAGWTLAEAEVAPPSPDDTKPTGLPPLPESDPSDGFDPFADRGERMTSEPPTAGQGASPTEKPPSEPPMLVWDESASEAVPAQSEPEPQSEPERAPEAETEPVPASGALPQIAPQTSRTHRAAQTDPFAFDTDSSDSPSQPETATPSDTATPSNEQPQMLILGDSQGTSGDSGDEPVEMAIEPLPARSDPQSVGARNADETGPQSSDASAGFDPFAGAAASDESAPEFTGGSPPASQSDLSRSGTNETTTLNTFDPVPPTDPQSTAQTEPSRETTDPPADDPQSAGDPFSFPSPASDAPDENKPLAGKQPAAGKPTFDPFPATAVSEPSEPPPAPTWPEGNSSRSRQSAEDPAPFPTPDLNANDEQRASDAPASRQSDLPQTMTFEPTQVEPAEVEPTPAFAGQSQAPTSAAPNPFSFDAGPSRPIIRSPRDAQRVVGEREITVTPSDSFWSISEREYGNSRYFNALARYNKDRVAKPEHLQSGMKILIPPPEVLEHRFPELFQRTARGTPAISPMNGTSSPTPAEPGLFLDEMQRPFYRVGEKDTLSTIARQHLGRSSRWTEIYDLNKDRLKSPSTLTIGMVLKLPPDASRVRVSPAGGFDR